MESGREAPVSLSNRLVSFRHCSKYLWILNSFNPEGKTSNNINKEMEGGKLKRIDTAVVTEGQRDIRREGT